MRIFPLIIVLICCVTIGSAAWLILTPWGAECSVREVSRRTLGVDQVSWSKIEGSLLRGIQVDQLEVHNIPFLPFRSFLRVQSLSIRLTAFTLNGLDVDVVNARFFLWEDQPVVFNGALRGSSVSGNVYVRRLDLVDVRALLTQFFDVPPFKGVLTDVDLFVGGRWDRPDVTGRAVIDRIYQNEFVLGNVPVMADLHFQRGRPRWETRGRLYLESGWLRNDVVLIDLQKSHLTFSGLLARPELDIHAVSRVARTKIDIKVRGTRLMPQVDLKSEPPYSKEQLFLMLATGKRWSGVVDGTATQRSAAPVLATNFADYLLFGGERVKIIRALGLSDISFNVDQNKQGVTLSKDVTDRLGVGYGVEMGISPGSQRDVTHRLEGEYQLTDKFILGAQKEMKPAHVSGALDEQNMDAPVTGGSSLEIPDDRIFLKYRTAF